MDDGVKTGAGVTILPLHDAPRHGAVAARWTWETWWAPSGAPLSLVETWVAGLTGEGPRGGVVALAEGTPVGSALMHETEAPDRPAFTPYLGALYVLPAWRRRGVGALLVAGLEGLAASRGYPALWLNAAPGLAAYYERLGWRTVETGYSEHDLTILRRDLLPQPAPASR